MTGTTTSSTLTVAFLRSTITAAMRHQDDRGPEGRQM